MFDIKEYLCIAYIYTEKRIYNNQMIKWNNFNQMFR